MVILFDELGNQVKVSSEDAKELLKAGKHFPYFSAERLKEKKEALKKEKEEDQEEDKKEKEVKEKKEAPKESNSGKKGE